MIDAKNRLLDLAKKKLRKILLVEGEDERVIEAARLAKGRKVAEPLLLGSQKNIEKIAKKNKINVEGIEIIDYLRLKDFGYYVNQLVEIRKNKGMDKEEAKKLLKNPNYFGALYLKLGKVHGAVGGCRYSTAEWMRPVFQVIGKKDGVICVSGLFIFTIKNRMFVCSDSDFVIAPSAEELAQIAVNAAGFAKAFGLKPKVAFLSHSTKGSGEHPVLERIRKAAKIANEKAPEFLIDAEYQFDAAINPNSAKRKCPNAKIQGDANVLIFPEIMSANIFAHSFTQLTDSKTYGTFPVGLQKAVANGGRSFNAEQIVDSIISCAAQINMEIK